MSFVGSVDDIWTEIALCGEENTRGKDSDAGNVWNFGGAIRELSKIFRHFGLKSVAVADSDWDEGDWEIDWTEGRCDLGKEVGGGDLINDDCDKHNDNNCDGDCGNNTSCTVSIIN